MMTHTGERAVPKLRHTHTFRRFSFSTRWLTDLFLSGIDRYVNNEPAWATYTWLRCVLLIKAAGEFKYVSGTGDGTFL